MSAALRPSCACPSVSLIAIGRPLVSTKAWILVVRPPRERPMHAARAWFGPRMSWHMAPFFAVGTMLMHPDRRGVDHLQIAVIGLRHSGEEAVPHANFGPAPKAVGTGARRPVSLGDVRPGRAGPQPPVNPIEHLAVVGARNAPWLVRQQRLNDRPLEIRQFIAAWVHHSTSRHLESPHTASGKDFYEFMT